MTAHVEELVESVLAADSAATVDAFCRLTKEGHSLPELTLAGLGAAAPFQNVPAHVILKPDGELHKVNYDHVFMGVRASLAMAQGLPDALRLLPITQAFSYLADGIDPWDQVMCQTPGFYAQKCSPYPAAPKRQVYFEDCEPNVAGSVDERFWRFQTATVHGDRVESYRTFLGLAEDPTLRERVKEMVLFLSIIDIQDTVVTPAKSDALQNLGHKSFQARSAIEIADYLGWDRSHRIFYGIIPDLACWPRFYELWTDTTIEVPVLFGEGWRTLKQRNQRPIEAAERDRTIDLVSHSFSAVEVKDQITALLNGGVRFTDIAQTVLLGYSQYVIDGATNEKSFFTAGHAHDYCNVVHYWIRTFDNPDQVKGLYLMALQMNDAIQAQRYGIRGAPGTFDTADAYRAWADGLDRGRTLSELQSAIARSQSGYGQTAALVDSYLARFEDRRDLIAALGKAAMYWQADPHLQRNAATTLEEWTQNTVGERDLLLRSQARYLAGGKKRGDEHATFDAFHRYFLS